MSEIIAAILALLLTAITGYFYSRFLKSPKPIGNARLFTIALVVIALSIFILSVYVFNVKPSIFVVDNATPSPEGLPTPSKTSTPSGTITTPIPLLVIQWNIKYDCKNNATVPIIGVTISGGLPPYEIIFAQNDKIISSTLDYPIDGKVSFSEPIVVNAGSYVHVTIRSGTIDGNPQWSGDLYFPLTPPGICK